MPVKDMIAEIDELCPFCGGHGLPIGRKRIKIKCQSCGAQTEVYELLSDAIAAWKKRPE